MKEQTTKLNRNGINFYYSNQKLDKVLINIFNSNAEFLRTELSIMLRNL